MAHYKYLGHELKKELGDSVNVRELTEEETPFIEYMRQHGPPSKSIEPPIEEDAGRMQVSEGIQNAGSMK